MTNDAGQFWLFIAAHASGVNRIHLGRFNSATGEFPALHPAAATPNPGYCLLTQDARFLYVCNQADSYEPGLSGGVSAFAFDARAGELAPLNSVSSHGIDPSHLAFDRTGRHIFVANYASGTFAIRRIEADGSLGHETALRALVGSSVHPVRQKHAYAHSSVLDPGGHYVLVCDLGSDKLWIFAYDEATGTLAGDPTFAATPPGDGARLVAFHPNGRWLYVNGEMGNCVCRYDWDAAHGTAILRSRATTLPAGFEGVSTTADMLLSDDGRRITLTNRGHDSVVTMAIDPATGDPTAVGFVATGGGKPRSMAFSPDRRWAMVANYAGNNVTVFALDGTSGALKQHGPSIELQAPYCPRFAPVRA